MKKFLKDILKQIIPNEIVQRIRVGKNILYYSKVLEEMKKTNGKKIIFLGTAIHTNLGDHLITLAVEKFIEDSIDSKNIFQIPTEIYQIYRKQLSEIITKDDLIVINGGGWMGNLWVKEEKLIQDMIVLFKNNRIIIFPQTIYYDEKEPFYKELIDSAKVTYNMATNLLITVREEQSYNFIKENFPNVHTILVPDIALYLNDELVELKNIEKSNIIKLCLRQDRENVRNEKIGFLYEIFKKRNLKISSTDTLSPKRISEKNRKKVVLAKLKEFSSAKFIVTDRLHGMIFAFLVKTPCLILDNKTKKVSGVYEKWLKNYNSILPLYKISDINEIEKFIDFYIDYNNENTEKEDFELKTEFLTLKEILKNG